MPQYLWVNTTRSIRRALSGRSGYTVVKVQGLSLPNKDHLSVRGPRQHGAIYIDTFFRPRDFSLTLMLSGCDPQALQARHRELVRAMNPLDAGELRITTEDERRYTLTCRPVSAMSEKRHNPRIMEILAQFRADDPYFRTAQQTISFTSAIGTGLQIPFNIAANLISPTANFASPTITNNGHVPVFPTIVINGQVDAPIIRNNTTGKQLNVAGLIPAGETLTVDMGLRTIIQTSGGGTVNKLGDTSGDFWELEPGANALIIRDVGSTIFSGTVQFSEAFLAVI